MAKVSLSNVQVSRVFSFQGGQAADVIESYKTRDGEGKTKYTLWFTEPHGLQEGAIVNAEGLLSARIREFESPKDGTVRYVQLSLNKPTVSIVQPSSVDKVGHAAVNAVWPGVNGPGKVEPVAENAPF